MVVAAMLFTPAAAEAAPPARCDLPATKTITDEPWASRQLAYRSVWPITQGAGVTVAVVDTGVNGAHPMLAGRVLPGVDVVNGGGRADTDCAGHGTAVAGIVAARQVAGIGFAGVAPQATILPIRQANATDGTVSTLAAGIRAAVDAGARVMNVSIVVPEPVPALTQAVSYAIEHDVVVVAAAGNDAQQGNPGQYPAGYSGVIAVGAVGPDGKPGDFSETGMNMSVVAPGVDIVVPGAGGPGVLDGKDGTSYAAPFVAGVAALIRAYRPELTAAQVKHRIEATADHHAGALPDPAYGFGMVNPLRAVTADLPEESAAAGNSKPAGVSEPAAGSGAEEAAADDGGVAWAPMAGIAVAVCAIAEVVGFGAVGLRRRGWRPSWRRGWRPGERPVKLGPDAPPEIAAVLAKPALGGRRMRRVAARDGRPGTGGPVRAVRPTGRRPSQRERDGRRAR